MKVTVYLKNGQKFEIEEFKSAKLVAPVRTIEYTEIGEIPLTSSKMQGMSLHFEGAKKSLLVRVNEITHIEADFGE